VTPFITKVRKHEKDEDGFGVRFYVLGIRLVPIHKWSFHTLPVLGAMI